MDDAPEPLQFWIRNDQGKVWGPMAAGTLGLLIPQGAFPGRLQASTDGLTFAMIGRFPDLRETIPESYWGIDPSEVVEDAIPADLLGSPVDDVISADALGPPVEDAIPADALGPPVEDVIPADALGPPVDEVISADALGPPVDEAVPLDAVVPDEEEGTDPGVSAARIPAVGTLADTSLARLAYLVAAAGATCRVRVDLPDGEAWVFYRKGAPEAVFHPRRTLGAWLVESGLLDEARRRQAEEAAAGFGGSLPGALFGLGLLDPGTAFPHLARHAADAYQALLREPEGAFRVDEDAAAPGDAFPLGAPALSHLVAAARSLDAAALSDRLGSRRLAPAMKSNASVLPFEDLRLGPQEARLYPFFDGVHSPAEIAGRSEDAAGVLRMAWLLGECDFLSFGEPRAEPAASGPGPEGRAAPPAPPRPAPTSAEPATDWAAEAKRLTALRDRLAKADHFSALGLRRQCSAADVKAAYTESVRKYHPDRAAGAPDRVKAVLRDLFERVTEAYQAIADDGQRRAYLNDLAAAELERAESSAIEDALAPARPHLKAGRWAEAGRALDEILGANPGLAAAWAWRAWVKVKNAKDPKLVRKEAVDLVNRALKLDPRSGEAWLAAGRIAGEYGDAVNAEKYLHKAKALGAKED